MEIFINFCILWSIYDNIKDQFFRIRLDPINSVKMASDDLFEWQISEELRKTPKIMIDWIEATTKAHRMPRHKRFNRQILHTHCYSAQACLGLTHRLWMSIFALAKVLFISSFILGFVLSANPTNWITASLKDEKNECNEANQFLPQARFSITLHQFRFDSETMRISHIFT